MHCLEFAVDDKNWIKQNGRIFNFFYFQQMHRQKRFEIFSCASCILLQVMFSLYFIYDRHIVMKTSPGTKYSLGRCKFQPVLVSLLNMEILLA